MKKLLTTIVSVLLAAVMVMFVGCGDKSGETGVIKGDYKEATAVEVAAKLNGVNTETMFGDQTAEDWAAGLSVYLGFDMSQAGIESSIKLNYDAAFAVAEESLSLIGKGELTAKMPDEEGKTQSSSGNIYNDGDFIYLDAGDEGKIKLSIEEIMMLAMSMMGGMQDPGEPMNVEEGGDETVGGEDAMSLAAIVMMLDEMGVKFAMDTANDELKVKMSFTKEFMMGIMGAPVAEEGADTLVDPFKEFVFDLYLHIDAQGQLVAFTAQIDIAMEMPSYDYESGDAITVESSMSAVMAIRVTDGSGVELPAGIATDTTYVALPLESLMGGMMG